MNNTTGKSSILERISKYPYTIIGAIILAIGVSHFVLQISYIQNENLHSAETAAANNIEIAPPVKQTITIEPEQVEVKKIKVITIPEAVKPEVSKPVPIRPKESIPVRKPIRKKEVKEVRETRAVRLKRAERILTGV